MMTLEDMLDELNETDTESELKELRSAVVDMESCETTHDFVANLDTALQAAGMILAELKKLKKQILAKGYETP